MAIILTQEERDVLGYQVLDPDVWAGRPMVTRDHVDKKVKRIRPHYDAAVARGDYKNRTQRDANEVQAETDKLANEPYSQKRRRAYPNIWDQLGALWKGGQEVIDMKAKIDKVRSDYPKP